MSASPIRLGPPPTEDQGGQPSLVGGINHMPDRVLMRRHKASDGGRRVMDADAMMIKARRTRTDSCSARREIFTPRDT
jgi:hypothetical protein